MRWEDAALKAQPKVPLRFEARSWRVPALVAEPLVPAAAPPERARLSERRPAEAVQLLEAPEAVVAQPSVQPAAAAERDAPRAAEEVRDARLAAAVELDVLLVAAEARDAQPVAAVPGVLRAEEEVQGVRPVEVRDVQREARPSAAPWVRWGPQVPQLARRRMMMLAATMFPRGPEVARVGWPQAQSSSAE